MIIHFIVPNRVRQVTSFSRGFIPMTTDRLRPDRSLPVALPSHERLLTRDEFQRLAEVPPEVEWFANLKNQHTRRAYRNDIQSFMTFVGIKVPTEFRTATRAHVIAW